MKVFIVNLFSLFCMLLVTKEFLIDGWFSEGGALYYRDNKVILFFLFSLLIIAGVGGWVLHGAHVSAILWAYGILGVVGMVAYEELPFGDGTR